MVAQRGEIWGRISADRRRLIEKAGALPGRLLKQVEDGLRLVLEL